MKLTVAVSGASGVNLALKFIEKLPKDIEVFLVFSKSSKKALALENGIKLKDYFKEQKNITIYSDKNIDVVKVTSRKKSRIFFLFLFF